MLVTEVVYFIYVLIGFVVVSAIQVPWFLVVGLVCLPCLLNNSMDRSILYWPMNLLLTQEEEQGEEGGGGEVLGGLGQEEQGEVSEQVLQQQQEQQES